MGASPEGAPAVESSAAWPAAPCAAGPTGWHDGAAGDRAAGGRLGDQAPGHGILGDWNSSSRVGQPPLPQRIGAGPRCFCVRDFRKTYMPDLRSMRLARLGPSAWRGRSRSSGSPSLVSFVHSFCQRPSCGGSGAIVVTYVAGVARGVLIAAFVIMTACDLEALTVLVPHLADLAVERVSAAGRSVHVLARTCARQAACTGCGVMSRRVHSSYQRQLADTASGGQEVLIDLQVRRFFCGNPACAKTTFAEQVPGLTSRYQPPRGTKTDQHPGPGVRGHALQPPRRAPGSLGQPGPGQPGQRAARLRQRTPHRLGRRQEGAPHYSC